MGLTVAGNDMAIYPSLGQARYAQVLLGLLALFTAMDIAVVGLLVEPIKLDLHLSDVEVSMAQTTTFFVAYGILATPMGMLVDRISRVRMIAVALSLWCGGLIVTALAHDLTSLATGKIILGAANAITYPAAMSLMADYFPPQRRAFATMSYPIGQTLGNAGALLVGGLAFSALAAHAAAGSGLPFDLAPWRIVSLIFAALGFLLIPFFFSLREPARMEMSERQGGSLRTLSMHRRFLMPLFAGIAFLAGGASGAQAWIAPALMRIYALEPGGFAAGYSILVLVASLLSLLGSARLVNLARDRGGDGLLLLPAALGALICAPASFMAVMPGISGFAILGFIFAIGSGIAIAIPVVAINLRMPNELRGLTIGLYVILFAGASAIGAPLVGLVSDLMGGPLMLGRAMGAVCAPFFLLATFSFGLTLVPSRAKSMPVVSRGN